MARRIRLVGDNGYDFPAWSEGNCAVFKIPSEQVIEGREWAVYHTTDGWLAETVERDEAFRIAREGLAAREAMEGRE